MNTAQHVVAKFGGQSALARLIGKGPSTVRYWTKSGVIPAQWHAQLLQIARDNGIDLSPSDLVEVPESPGNADLVPKIPEAKWPGVLPIGEKELEVYVLDDGRRVISRTGATAALVGPQGGGNLESFIGVQALRGYIPADLQEQFFEFAIPGVVNKTVLGMTAETFLDICNAYVCAQDAGVLKSESQARIAGQAAMFLSAVAKVGLIALIDEVTGYQYERAQDALQLKLKLFLAEEMRKWEKTFPDELWREFGRLTHWRGTLHQRPKYWGHLVMELVYQYLDPDVADWLKKNNPKPQHGWNYFQWLNEQYGLKKLVEHLWMLIGMASACTTMPELKRKMAEKYGRVSMQMTLYLPHEVESAHTGTSGGGSPGWQSSRRRTQMVGLPLVEPNGGDSPQQG
jgi:hypothetical protein